MGFDPGSVTPYPMLCFFVALPAGPPLDESFLDGCATTVKHWPMEQWPPPAFPRLRVDAYDLCYDADPDYDEVVPRVLRRAVLAGATVAWFLFEGTFTFDDLLVHPRYHYGVAWGEQFAYELDDDARGGVEWAAVVASARAALEPLL